MLMFAGEISVCRVPMKLAGCTQFGLLVLCLAGCGGDNHPSADAERPSTQAVNATLKNKYATAKNFETQIKKRGGRIKLSLDLSYTKLTDEDLAQIEFPRYLTELNLTGCPISDEGLGPLTQSDNLLQLDLSHTLVTEGCLETLEKIPSLQAVHLHGTAIKPDAQRKMMRVFRLRNGTKRSQRPE